MLNDKSPLTTLPPPETIRSRLAEIAVERALLKKLLQLALKRQQVSDQDRRPALSGGPTNVA